MAAVAIGAIGENAATAETVLDQLRIDIRIDQMRRRGDLRARLPVFQITAWIRRSGIEL